MHTRTFSVQRATAIFLFALLCVVFTFTWVRNAWMSDDAYITLRTVSNFVQGLGPNFNPGERVQTFTHPLWFLLLIPTHALSGEGYYSTLLLSFFVSLATIGVFYKFLARTPQQALFGIGALILSKASIDYSSAGLENPLSHFCLALFFVFLFKEEITTRRLLYATLAAAFVTLTRFDLILFVVAPLTFIVFQTWRAQSKQRAKIFLALAIGFAPLLLWLAFSLWYYGMLLPNTYYAKTPANVSLSMWLAQGANYFQNSLRVDPITLTLTACGIFFAVYSRNFKLVSIALGICFYLLYVLKIGGDFMSGRFFTAALFCALVILARVELLANLKLLAPLAVLCIVLGLLAPNPPLFVSPNFGATTDAERLALFGADRVSDQRAFFYHWTGLLRNLDGTKNFQAITEVKQGLAAQRKRIRIYKTTGLGLRSYYAGPTKYVIDEMTLAEPFLAWLPRKEGWWVIGHFTRCVPIGYARTLRAQFGNSNSAPSKRNSIQDRALASFYDDVAMLTRGNLWDVERLAIIFKFNTGGYDALRSRMYPCENFWNGKPAPEFQIAR